MTSRALKTAAAGTALALLAYWYGSPYLTIHAMRSAAQARDAEAFNAYIDYPSIREDLKDQFSGMMADQLEGPARRHGGLAQAGAALGAMLGMAVADRAVDAMVRPQYIMRAMEDGQFDTKRRRGRDRRASSDDGDRHGQGDGSGAPPDQPAREKVHWRHERQGVNRLIAYPERADGSSGQQVGLVMERRGFADWKLTAIRLPQDER